MRARSNAGWGMALPALCFLALAGCAAVPPPPTHVEILHASPVGNPVVTIDPATGDKIRTTQWTFPDGVKTVTVERIRVGGDNEFRRNPPEPPPRVIDD